MPVRCGHTVLNNSPPDVVMTGNKGNLTIAAEVLNGDVKPCDGRGRRVGRPPVPRDGVGSNNWGSTMRWKENCIWGECS